MPTLLNLNSECLTLEQLVFCHCQLFFLYICMSGLFTGKQQINKTESKKNSQAQPSTSLPLHTHTTHTQIPQFLSAGFIASACWNTVLVGVCVCVLGSAHTWRSGTLECDCKSQKPHLIRTTSPDNHSRIIAVIVVTIRLHNILRTSILNKVTAILGP